MAQGGGFWIGVGGPSKRVLVDLPRGRGPRDQGEHALYHGRKKTPPKPSFSRVLCRGAHKLGPIPEQRGTKGSQNHHEKKPNFLILTPKVHKWTFHKGPQGSRTTSLWCGGKEKKKSQRALRSKARGQGNVCRKRGERGQARPAHKGEVKKCRAMGEKTAAPYSPGKEGIINDPAKSEGPGQEPTASAMKDPLLRG